MELIQFTAISITVLTQATLLVLCIIYLVQQRDLRTPGWVMIWFCVSALLYCVAQFISESLRHHNPVHAFLIPLQFIPISLSASALIQLAYRFPINYIRFKFERNLVLAISVVIVMLITAFTLNLSLIHI